jgi:hypothetical protein
MGIIFSFSNHGILALLVQIAIWCRRCEYFGLGLLFLLVLSFSLVQISVVIIFFRSYSTLVRFFFFFFF